MYNVDVPKVKGKMGEKDFSIAALSNKLEINRNTLTSYLNNPNKIPYDVLSGMASILCDSQEEAARIFFNDKLT